MAAKRKSAAKRKPPAHDVADLSLAREGEARVAWADTQMPVLAQVRERLDRERPLAGVTVGVCLHVTAETANLVRALCAGGARVGLCASNPLSTRDDVAAALVERHGVAVFARRGEDAATYDRHLDAVCDLHPEITVDDGADFVSVLHGRRTDQLDEIVGGTEETASGVLRLRALDAEGGLRFPVLAVNEAATAELFDGRYGTGQSTLDGIVRATNALLSGRRLVVLGYGSCGRGVALRAKGAGANVIVCEVDPLRALEAAMEGYELLPSIEAAAEGDIFVTVTGSRDVLGADHFAAMKDGAIVANAGHFDVEIDKAALRTAAKSRREVRPLVEEHVMQDGRRLYLLADGRVVNLASADGHPSVVMDICFAVQALAIEHIARVGKDLEPGVHPVPAQIDHEIARLKLDSLGARIDELTDEQSAYLGSWQQSAR